MNAVLVRRAVIGLMAGAISSGLLVATLGNVWVALALGAGLGAAQRLAFGMAPRAYLSRAMASGAMGAPLWALVSVVALPTLARGVPQWTPEGMRELFPAMVGWVLYGALLGLLTQAFSELAEWRLGREQGPRPLPVPVNTRIVILGGGFAGVTAAQHLEAAFGADRSVSITLVSDTNALLFTPLLAEVAASSLEPTHISSPLRTILRRTRVVRARAVDVDLERRCVRLAPEPATAGVWSPAEADAVPFHHLVLALGSVSNYLGMRGVEEHAFEFKTLLDAIRIRNQVIDVFERADREAGSATREALLTFVVAGGGFAGTELAGALNDFARGMLVLYPRLPAEALRIVLVHSRERILPELTASLAGYALERMAARGVTFKLNTRVADARKGVVVLDPPEEVRAETLIWTAGVAPSPLLQRLPFERDRRGAAVVDRFLAVPGHTGVWALGDCAAVTDSRTGQPCPPTAQFALREAQVVAHNVRASVQGRPPKPFTFDALGVLCVVGHHVACAEVKGLRFSGLFAWLLWRGIYLARLPGLERKVRVLADWVLELFFPRDIVQTIDLAGGKQP